MNAGVRLVLVVLNVLGQTAVGIDREYIAKTSVFVEWVSVNVVWRLASCENENRTGVGVFIGGRGFDIALSVRKMQQRVAM